MKGTSWLVDLPKSYREKAILISTDVSNIVVVVAVVCVCVFFFLDVRMAILLIAKT